jgi:hypothetical protein
MRRRCMVGGEFVQEVMRGLGAAASSEEAVAQAEVSTTEIAGDLILHNKLHIQVDAGNFPRSTATFSLIN